MEQIDFSIEWPERIPDSNTAPATTEELRELMDKIRTEADKAEADGVIMVKARREVVREVVKNINKTETAFAAMDMVDDAWFNKEKGFYESTITIAKDKTFFDAWYEGF